MTQPNYARFSPGFAAILRARRANLRLLSERSREQLDTRTLLNWGVEDSGFGFRHYRGTMFKSLGEADIHDEVEVTVSRSYLPSEPTRMIPILYRRRRRVAAT